MEEVLLSLSFGALGLVTGRWVVLVAPPLAWGTWAVGLAQGWWGDDPGEFLVLGTLILSAIGVSASAAGVLVHRAARRLRRRSR